MPHQNKIAQGAFLLYCLLVVVFTVMVGWDTARDTHPFLIGDWMINYEAGLVRRGMFGQLVFTLSMTFGFSPNFVILTIQLFCYLVLFYCVARMFMGLDQPVHFLPLVMAPFFLAFQIHDEVAGFRKEILFLALIAYLSYISTQKNIREFKGPFISVLLVFPVFVLSHEMLMLYSPYFLVLLLVQYPDARLKKYFLLPVVIAIILLLAAVAIATFYTGSAIEVFKICRSWGEHAPFRCTEQGGIYWLKGTLADSMGFVFQDISSGQIKVNSALCLLLVALPFVYLGPKVVKVFGKHKYVPILIIMMLVGTVMLLIIARDWGRILYIHAAATSLILLASVCRRDALNQTELGGLSAPQTIIYIPVPLVFLVAVFFSVSWRLPHWLGSDPFLNFFSRWLVA